MSDPATSERDLPFDQCYRHAGRRAGVRCQRCGRAICPDCMVTASVGFQCPECVKRSGTRIIRAGDLAATPWVTNAVVGINIAVFVAQLTSGGGLGMGRGALGEVGHRGSLVEFLVADGEWWRLVTSGFLHSGLIHIGFNMFLAYRLGTLLEPKIGSVRFALLYVASLLCGSLGVVLLSGPAIETVGASGAVFGLMGAALVGWRREGFDPWRTDIGSLLILNLVLTFAIPGISIGGHLGGLAGGVVAGFLLTEEGSTVRRVLGSLASAALAVGAFVLALSEAGL